MGENSFTKYHNHPKNGCVLKVLQGQLLEINKNNMLTLNKDNVGIKLHNEFHRILANEQSYSLHYYSPPNFYDN